MALIVKGSTVKKLIVKGTTCKTGIAKGVTVFKAEKVISEGTSTNLWGTPTRTGSESTQYKLADGGLNPVMWNVWMDWRDSTWTFPNTISTSGYTKLCIEYKWKFTGYGEGSVRLLINGAEKANTGWGTTGNAYVNKTLTLDVSGMNSVKLGVLLGCHDSGGGANTSCVITKSWLE